MCSGDGLDAYGVLDLLTSLVDKSLVLADDGQVVVRYRMLETVREYALDLLRESGEHDALRQRHRDFFLALAERIAPELMTINQREWLDAIDPDAGNFAAAIDRGAQTDPDLALRLCAALTFWWKLRGSFAAAEAAYDRALGAADTGASQLRARVLWARAYLLGYAGDYMTAIGAAHEALAAADAVGDDSTTARALDVLGTIQLFPDPIGARPGLERSIELARKAGDEWCLADATQILAFSHFICDELSELEDRLNEALPIVERNGYGEQLAWHWVGMSYRPWISGQPERFLELAERAVAIAGEIGEPVTAAFAHALMGLLEIAQGQPSAAADRLETSMAVLLASGGGMALPVPQLALASAHAALGELDRANALLGSVVDSRADYGYFLAWTQTVLADVRRAQGDATGAYQLASEALVTSDRLGSTFVSASSREILGRLAAGRAEWAAAEHLLHEALATRAERELRLGPQTLDALAQVAARLQSSEEAARLLGAAKRARNDLGLVRWPPDEPDFTILETTLRGHLGDGPFEAALSEGAAMPLDDAVAWIRRARGSRKRPSRGWESLTPPESQVVELTAQGLTNPEIGERLLMSRATVKAHHARVPKARREDTRRAHRPRRPPWRRASRASLSGRDAARLGAGRRHIDRPCLNVTRRYARPTSVAAAAADDRVQSRLR